MQTLHEIDFTSLEEWSRKEGKTQSYKQFRARIAMESE